MTQKITLKELLPLLGLTLSTFVVNTSEFIPIGLLTDIAATFQLSEARAGLLISVYALVVMLTSLPLMLLASKVEYKKLLVGTIALFAVFQIGSAIAPTFGLLMAARLGVACTHAIFWAIASPLAVRVVSEHFHSLALSMIATGTSIALIAGVPIGRIIGLQLGWRMTFGFIAALSLVILVLLLFVFPKVENTKAFSFRQLPELFRNRALVSLYLFTALLVTAYYMCYSYIEPFLAQVAGFSETRITETLTLYGACGLIGSFLYARRFEKGPALFIRTVTASMVAALFLLGPAAVHPLTITFLCAFWGIIVTCFNVMMQGEVIYVSPAGASSIAMAIYSGIYNLGIGAGSWIGGLVTEQHAIGSIGTIGGVLGIAALLFCFLRFTRLIRPFHIKC